MVGDPLDDATDVSALIDPGETERVKSWIDEAVEARGPGRGRRRRRRRRGAGAPPCWPTSPPTWRCAAPRCSARSSACRSTTTSTRPSRLANDTRYGLQAGIFTADLDTALLAARTLDFGGVTVNEVPTWRADQMPYGGVRDSGNTREGPAYAAREMTEERLVVIHSPSLP